MRNPFACVCVRLLLLFAVVDLLDSNHFVGQKASAHTHFCRAPQHKQLDSLIVSRQQQQLVRFSL